MIIKRPYHNLDHYDKTKHVEIDKHFIKEKLNNILIYMPYISTIKQPDDVFIKRLV